jgi:hypothetical protein
MCAFILQYFLCILLFLFVFMVLEPLIGRRDCCCVSPLSDHEEYRQNVVSPSLLCSVSPLKELCCSPSRIDSATCARRFVEESPTDLEKSRRRRIGRGSLTRENPLLGIHVVTGLDSLLQ